MPAKLIDLTGQTFGHLTVVRRSSITARGVTPRWLCHCDCGNLTEVAGADLRHGKTKSCGRASGRSEDTLVEYRALYAARARCEDPSASQYEDYGGRGIQVYPGWKGHTGFACFLASVGRKPSSEHSLDRIDVNGNYEPGNVRWATRQEQADNRRKVCCLEKFTDAELFSEVKRRGLKL